MTWKEFGRTLLQHKRHSEGDEGGQKKNQLRLVLWLRFELGTSLTH